jgi:hypothetical protein
MVTNERGEIQSCNLVATKAHSQFTAALNNMRESLQLYGHNQPSIFYTDNMSDKMFLETSFPSLRENVVPIDKFSHLEPFRIPDGVHIRVKNTASSINDAISTILDDLSDTDNNQMVVVGFDTEWNVERSDTGRIVHRGGTATVQIAYADRIYVLQVSSC